MNTIVCIKQVPDTATKVQIAADGRSIQSGELNYVMNPYDEFAVEAATTLKEQHGGEVTAVCLGTQDAVAALRSAVALGADHAVLLKTDRPDIDASATATALAEAIRARSPDLVLFGKQAVDDDNAQVGPMVAELLSIPCVCQIVNLEYKDGIVMVNKQVEGGEEVVSVSLPAVLTTQKGLNEPRYASLKDIMRAKRAPIDEQEVSLIPSRVETIELNLPAERQAGLFIGQGTEAVPELIQRLKEEAKVL